MNQKDKKTALIKKCLLTHIATEGHLDERIAFLKTCVGEQANPSLLHKLVNHATGFKSTARSAGWVSDKLKELEAEKQVLSQGSKMVLRK